MIEEIQYTIGKYVIENYLFITYFFIFLIGISTGSFINNYALRMAEKIDKINISNNWKIIEKIMMTQANEPKVSICPICQNKLKWWMNIPLFSWIYLKGKCHYCSSKIPVIYIISEIFFGIIFVIITMLSITISNTIINIVLFTMIYTHLLFTLSSKTKYILKHIMLIIFILILIKSII